MPPLVRSVHNVIHGSGHELFTFDQEACADAMSAARNKDTATTHMAFLHVILRAVLI
jgi:hypothetical protein